MLQRKFTAFILLSFAALSLFSCSSSADPLTDPKAVVIILIRRDTLGGQINVIVDGKNVGKVLPTGNFAYRVAPGSHTLAIEYNKMKTANVSFKITDAAKKGNRVEYDVWAYENTIPNLRQKL